MGIPNTLVRFSERCEREVQFISLRMPDRVLTTPQRSEVHYIGLAADLAGAMMGEFRCLEANNRRPGALDGHCWRIGPTAIAIPIENY